MNQNDASKKDNDNSNQLDTELIGSYQSITIGFSKDELASFSKIGQHKHYTAGSIIYNENDLADSFFIIIDGVAEIFKKTIDEFGEHNIHILATLSKDDVVGEMALIENSRRSASVKAKTDLSVIEYPLEVVKAKPKLNLMLIKNMAQILSRRLRFTNEVTVKNMQQALKEASGRNTLGVFIIALLWIICLYTLSLHFLVTVIHQVTVTTVLSICLISIFAHCNALYWSPIFQIWYHCERLGKNYLGSISFYNSYYAFCTNYQGFFYNRYRSSGQYSYIFRNKTLFGK
ncbi:cyclic nucleotide-binding domain-containing protein [Legionella pneumophila serogroup 1]